VRLSGAFCFFRLEGRQPVCVSKSKNHSKIHPCQVRSSFDGAEMWPDDEKAAENTCCIVKDFEEVWAHFCPPKPCLPLSTDTKSTYNINILIRLYQAERAGRFWAKYAF